MCCDWRRFSFGSVGSGADADPCFRGDSGELLRWAAVLDLLGYYLATAVLAYVLWRHLRPRNPLIADLSTWPPSATRWQEESVRPSSPRSRQC
jgi:hypothetical protein